MKDISSFQFEGFLPNIPYKIIHILDLVIDGNKQNRKDIMFRVLFSDLINEKYYRIRNISPVLLKTLTIGTIVKIKEKGMDIQITGEIIKTSLDIPKPKEQNLKQLGEVIKDNEYPMNIKFSVKENKNNKTKDLTEEIKNQYCIVIKKENFQFIFPILVISATFFFISQNFTTNLFNLNLEIEYHSVNTKNQSIHMKGGFNDIDAPFLYLYATNPLARQVYETIGKNLLIKHQERSEKAYRLKFPFKTYFPFSGKNIDFTLRGEWLSPDKFLVFDIERFDFTKILGINKLTVLRTEKEKSVEKKISFFTKKDSKTTNKLTDEVKADVEDFFEMLEKKIDDITDENFQIEKQNIYYHHEPSDIKRVPLKEKSEEEKNLTQYKHSLYLNNIGKGLNVKTDKKIKVSNIFSLDDFFKYFKEICYEIGISINKINKEKRIIKPNYIKTSKVSIVVGSSRKIREYMILKFDYNAKKITIIEIDHSDLFNNKLYTLVFSGNRSLSEKEVFNAVHFYLDKNKSLKDLESYFKQNNISLYKKKHPKEYDEKSIKDWIDTFVDVLKYKV